MLKSLVMLVLCLLYLVAVSLASPPHLNIIISLGIIASFIWLINLVIDIKERMWWN